MIWDLLESVGERCWHERRAFLGEVGEKADCVLDTCSREERTLLRAVLATLPLSDLGDHGAEFFLAFVREALELREKLPLCRALPERLFFLYVLYPRVNDEELADCRMLFRKELSGRVRGLSVVEDALEVNRWCAGHVTYRSTDDRTASPLSVYRRGYGRCGEESVFTVTALRSVGIAARQVYVPLWSHCDDNHAWVEFWDGERWRYLGACEPEPCPDRGWFTSAAARAMLVHARTFIGENGADWRFLFPETSPDALWEEDGVQYEAVTRRYAETALLTVSVLDEAGLPVPGARVCFSLLNMAAYRTVAVRKTGQDGSARLSFGRGSVQISASAGGRCAEMLTRLSEDVHVSLTLKKDLSAESCYDEEFHAPAAGAEPSSSLSQTLRRERKAVLEQCAALREARAVPEPPALSGRFLRVFETLTDKDRTGEVPAAVLEDALPAFAWEALYPLPVFEEALLCPRVGAEPLSPWRELLFEWFSPAERETFRTCPPLLWERICETVRPVRSYSRLRSSVSGTLRLRAGREEDRRVLFCAACRALGVPARLSPMDGSPEYWRDGAFHPLYSRSASLMIAGPDDRFCRDGQEFSLSRYCKDGTWQVLSAGDLPPGGKRRLTLPEGLYRLISVTRLPDGDQLSRRWELHVERDRETEASLSFREASASQLLIRIPLPPFSLTAPDGCTVESRELFRAGKTTLLLWLEPGREPTEHLLNELCEASEVLAGGGCELRMILENPDKENDFTLQKTRERLSPVSLLYGDFEDTAAGLARSLYLEPDRMPLAMLVNGRGECRWALAGYRVGAGELLTRLLRESL